MRKLLLICLITIVRLNVCAQGTITGHVANSEKQSVPFAAISVSRNETAVTGTVTDSEGRFIITDLESGVYKLAVALAGFTTYEREFVLGKLNKTLDFGNITLRELPVLMSQVTVGGQKLSGSAELDKKTFSTSDMITSSAGSVLDALKQLPGVTIDQESKVQIRGSDKVIVLIDGRQSALTGFGSQKGLENIPLSQIERIEIINNPSSKYDAAGSAGIVNIIFKPQQKLGFNGDAGFSLGLGQLTKRRADLPTDMPSYSRNPKYTPSINLNYKTEKTNVFLQAYWTNQERLPNNEFSTRRYPNGDVVESQVAENRTQDHYNAKFGFDWNLADNQTLTLFGLYDYEWHEDNSKVWYFKNGDYNAPIRKHRFKEPEGTGFTNGTLQHKLRFVQPGHELSSQYLWNGPSPAGLRT